MTKKHYEAIAKILIEANKDGLPDYYLDSIATGLANYFANDNKNFNRARFLEVCGVIEIIDYHPNANYKDCATNSALKDTSSRHYSGCHACGYTGR